MNSCRLPRNGGLRVAALDRRPAFFKILLPGVAVDRLRIPPAFTGHISNDLQAKAKLRGPSGGWWEIKLGQIDGKHYIHEGWRQFFDHHSLGDYEFLLFRYNGGLCFDVQIFDKSGCERIPKFYKEDEEHEEHEEHHHQPTSKRKRGRPRKKPEFSMNTEDDSVKDIMHEKQAPVKIEEDDTVDSSIETDKKDSPSLRSLDSFASVFPYFKCMMTVSCVQKSFIVPIPQDFSNEYFPRAKGAIFTTLNNIKGKEWKVKIIYNKHGKWVISGGWSLFARENHIKIDNVCVFELLDNINLIRVHILQDSQEEEEES